MSTVIDLATLSWVDRARLASELQHELLKNKSYETLPIGQDVAAYLRYKRKHLATQSFEVYEATLAKLALRYPSLQLYDLEPPGGVSLLEAFLDHHWADHSPRTYNKNLYILKDFLKFQRARGRMDRDPAELIERRRTEQTYRTTFDREQRLMILASQTDLRDRIALRLLLDYGLRRGSLLAIQFKHFDHFRKRLTIFAKGGKVRPIPLPDPSLWDELGRLLIDWEASGEDFLMARNKGNQSKVVLDPSKPMSTHGAHSWWYRCLHRAGVTAEGQTSGERMHKARHTAGQRLLDHTGNLKEVQQLLGHKSVATTADTYLGWDEQQLAASLASLAASEQEES